MYIDEAWIEIAEDFAKRIAALEHERHVWHEQENHLIDLCAEQEKRIAELEHTWNPEWDDMVVRRIAALEVELREFNNWVLKRISELPS